MISLGVVVGHTSEKQGATAVAPISKSEYALNRELAIDIWREAKEQGIDAKVYLKDKVNEGLLYAQVSSDNDASVELHFNSFSDASARGSLVLYLKDKDFAEAIHRNVISSLTEDKAKRKNNGVVLPEVGTGYERGIRQLKKSTIPCCIIEPFFGSNQKDCELFLRNRLRYCRAIVSAVIEWHNLKGK